MNIPTISNNPFRVLGVYSNASAKEITANKGKIMAFLKVHKSISFPSDLNNWLPEIERTEDMVSNSLAEINLPQDKILQALFWFNADSAIDQAALRHLESGNKEKAREILIKKASFSSWINLSILDFLDGNMEEGAKWTLDMIHRTDFCAKFLLSVVGEAFDIDESELRNQYLDLLCAVFPRINWVNKLRQIGANPEDISYMSSKEVGELTDAINKEIALMEEISNEDSEAKLKGTENLSKKSKRQIERLKTLLTTHDVSYQMIADKLALAIFHGTVSYYNSREGYQAAKRISPLLDYALLIAVGDAAKDKLSEAKNTLQQALSEEPDERISEQAEQLNKILRDFQNKKKNLAGVNLLIRECRPILSDMYYTVGIENQYYIKISTRVANLALSELIDIVNANQILSILQEGLSTMEDISRLNMSDDFRRNRFNPNNRTLHELYNSMSSMGTSYGGSGSSSKNDSGEDGWMGCFVWILIAIAIGMIKACCS